MSKFRKVKMILQVEAEVECEIDKNGKIINLEVTIDTDDDETVSINKSVYDLQHEFPYILEALEDQGIEANF